MHSSLNRIMSHFLLNALLGGTAVSLRAAQAAESPRCRAETPRARQLELVRSAAPPEVSGNATLYILGKQGYEVVQKGSNGFSCIVDRELVDTQEPECFDAEGSATTLLARMRVEELRAQGISEDKINVEIEQGYKAGTYKAPRKPGIVYMLSQENWVLADPATRTIINFGPHLMFYAPYATDKDIGNTQAPGAIPGVPFVVHPGRPDALIIVVPRLTENGKDGSGHAH
jgi:hypothetical protein